MPIHNRLFFVVALAGTLLLAACGGDSSSGSTSGTSAAPPTSSVASVAIAGSPQTTATAGKAYSFQPSVSQGSGTISFSITGQPHWASFNSATGALSGTPSTSDEGTSAPITISASNGSSSASLASFTIQVNAPGGTSGSAALSWSAPTINTNGTPITNLAGYHIYYGTNEYSLSNTVDITSPTATSYVIVGLSHGTYYFTIVAYNSAGVDSPQSSTVSKTI